MKKLNSLMLIIISFSLVSTTVFAVDTDPGFPGTDPGQPAAPINDWIVPMILTCLTFGFFIYIKQFKKDHK
jgi:hypothetical protein